MWCTRKIIDCFLLGQLLSAILFSLCLSDVAQAECKWTVDPGANSQTVALNIPDVISNPIHKPVGTVLFRSQLEGSYAFTCTGDSATYGVHNNAGGEPDENMIYPISGSPGLGFRWLANGEPIPPYPSSIRVKEAGGITFSKFAFELIKIGDVEPGSVVSGGGYIATIFLEQIRPIDLEVESNAVIGSGTCNAHDVKIDMGRHGISQFKGFGTRLPSVNAEIELDSCTELKRVKYRLDPTSRIHDAESSVIELSGDSTASGIGVQILDSTNEPLPLGQDNEFSNFPTQGGSFRIPFKAAYYQISGIASAGTANASLTFTMSYE